MRYLTYFLIAAPLWSATFNCTTTGTGAANWSNPAIWTSCNSTYPNNGGGNVYTATIGTARAVTLDVDVTIGTGGVAGTAALTLSVAGSQVIWGAGHAMTVTGDIMNTFSSNTDFTDWLVATSGATLTFDSTGGNRILGSTGTYTLRAFNWNCTGGSQCVITATGANISSFSTAANYSGNFKLYNVAVSNLGNAANPAFVIKSANVAAYGDWYAQSSTFTNCGQIKENGNLNTNATFFHDANIHSGSLTTPLIYLLPIGNLIGTGTRQISNNVFDNTIFQGVDTVNFTYSDNYMIGPPSAAGTAGREWTSFTHNFVRYTSMPSGSIANGTDSNYFYVDLTGANPHWGAPSNTKAQTNNIYDLFKLSGDCGEINNAQGGTNASGTNNNILVPGVDGNGNSELASMTAPMDIKTFNHNTVWPCNLFGVLNFNEVTSTVAGGVASYRSNLMFTPTAVPTWYKTQQVTNGVAAAGNPCNPLTNCDYNLAYNYTVVQTSCSGFCVPYPSTNGYNLQAWASGIEPGTHDLNAINPQINGYWRNVATFSRDYLGITANRGTWSSASVSYVVGDVVTETSTNWGGTTVNFRCIANHTSGASTEPGVGASWQTDWELDSLYRIRITLPTKATFTDLGITNGSIIAILVKWVQLGYTPNNPSTWCAGHDGETVGAVANCSKGKTLIGAIGAF